MKHHRQELWFNTPDRRGYINITPEVRDAVTASGVQHGLCLVNAMHITASVYINDDEPGLIADYDDWLEKLAPFNAGSDPASGGGGYRHNRTGEDNADAHMKRQVMGRSVTIAISDGELDFGPWEQVFYAEFDGRRKKRALIKIIGA
ncbi:MAG: secondary thiamine-phosphate synthase enzyme YjbQ [Planctomycetota bacterium]